MKNVRGAAIELCSQFYKAFESKGFYPALTGGCLYKKGNRKDIDIVIYGNRQSDKALNWVEMQEELSEMGVKMVGYYGFVSKAKYTYRHNVYDVDFLYPEWKSVNGLRGNYTIKEVLKEESVVSNQLPF